MIPRMWICPDCNQLVPNPVNRKCPNGHGLFDGKIFSFTEEQSGAKAFVNAFLVCLVIFVAVTSANALLPGHPLGKNAAGYPLVIFAAFGISALFRAWKWKRQGGPVLRLVPRAVGTGLGSLLAGVVPLVSAVALGLTH
jgi:hypothetical protein